MDKRGISPLLATVFLVGFAFLIGLVVMMFASETVDREKGTVRGLANEPIIVRFNAVYFDNCTVNGSVNCDSGADDTACYGLHIENTEDFDVSYLIKTFSDLGFDACGPVDVPAYGTKLINVYYDYTVVGKPNDPPGTELWADVVAVQ